MFAAGAAGALASALAVRAAAASGLLGALGAGPGPVAGGPQLAAQVAWGGAFGALFLLPFAPQRWIAQGLAVALVPALLELVAGLPRGAGAGIARGAPAAVHAALVLASYAVWGLAASRWLQATGR